MRLRKRTIAFGAVIVLILIVAAKWGELAAYLFLLFGVAPIMLFFQQDYRPWDDSLDDIASVNLDTEALTDAREISQMAVAAGNNRKHCSAFVARLHDQRLFAVEAQTYCKIRIRTECPCTGTGLAGPGKWVKIHLTRGAHKGSDVWVCGSSVGQTITPL